MDKLENLFEPFTHSLLTRNRAAESFPNPLLLF
jgi:hypothetical protein